MRHLIHSSSTEHMRFLVLSIIGLLFGKELFAIEYFNFYNTEELDNNDGYCLYYFEKTYLIELSNIIHYSFFKFCLREFDNNDVFVRTDRNQTNYYRLFTFDQLREKNITDGMLLKWSAPIDTIERYKSYLQNETIQDSLLYYNCTERWFGPLCQFQFEIKHETFSAQVKNAFNRHVPDSDPMRLFLHIVDTCYTSISCDYLNSLPVCLDWREICDGKIDCLNDGIDEQHCFDLEINECHTNEYRCHNGHCIPARFYRDDPSNPDCLDGSDEIFDYSSNCFFSASIRCEELLCRSESNHFPCGYGRCGDCDNGRDEKLDYTYIIRSNRSTITDHCWTSIVILTRMDHIGFFRDRFSCPYGNCIESVQHFCPHLFLYPIYPIAFGHVRFVHDNKAHTPKLFRFVPPTYVCYDAQLCANYLPPTNYIQIDNLSLTCRLIEQLPMPKIELYKNDWFAFRDAITKIFGYCSNSHRNHSHLYRCMNSTKYISKHRLLDGIQDCHLNDDEFYTNSCSLNHTHRFTCGVDVQICPSSLLFNNKKYDCLTRLRDLNYFNDDEGIPLKTPSNSPIVFQTLCDGFIERFPLLLYGENETDETHCEYWPCSNMYTRCDGYWNCLNGFDEINCSPNDNSICLSSEISCVSPQSYSLFCLNISKLNDGQIDCLGAFDERQWCRTQFAQPWKRYRCLNDDTCIDPMELCTTAPHCIVSMDDYRICSHDNRENMGEYDSLCNHGITSDYPHVDTNLCRLTDEGKPTEVYFRLNNVKQQNKVTLISNDFDFEKYFHDYGRLCNRGVPVSVRTGNGSIVKKKCLCPPSYYGSFCQYQNQRISVTIQFGAVQDWKTIFTFIIQLIDDRYPTTIYSYERIQYLAMRDCSTKFSFYLLYKTRSKDRFKNYSVRIDVYNTETFEYRASWLYPIRFSFLPVHRLALQISVPISTKNTSENNHCSMNCGEHGRCSQYENTKTMFCHCQSGWHGQYCSISYQCPCASSSQCHAPSICLCSIDKFGDRCHIELTGCSTKPCHQNQLCIPSDVRFHPQHSFTCICAEGFWGDRCQYETLRVRLTFHRTLLQSSFLYAHFITADGQSQHKQTTMLTKIQFDQNVVVLHVTYVYHLILIEINENYYLTFNRSESSVEIEDRCLSINEIFNSTIVNYHPLRRVKYYQLACQQIKHLQCFHDFDSFMCLCTNNNSEANCFNFEFNKYYDCDGKNYCQNDGQCFQDRYYCPTTSVCACKECFYGSQCQFSTEGFGLSLDAILGYHIRPNTSFDRQTNLIKISTVLVLIIFSLGLIGSILSIMTFVKKESQTIGCGLYLLATSIVSLLLMMMLVVKFTFLLLSQIGIIKECWILQSNCRSMDFLLRILFNIGDWLNICVSLERVVMLIQSTNFSKTKSKKTAKRMIFIVTLVTILTALQDPLHRELIDDDDNRTWCIVRYTSKIQLFNSIMLMFHFLVPFSLNILLAFLIIFLAARQRAIMAENYRVHLRKQFHEHKHMIISAFSLVLLASPRLIISFQVSCMNTTRDPWLSLTGYFISFIPSMLIFVVFILPSSLYKKTFLNILKKCRKRLFIG